MNKNIFNIINILILLFVCSSITFSKVIDVNSDTLDLGTINYYNFENYNNLSNKFILKYKIDKNLKLLNIIDSSEIENNNFTKIVWISNFSDNRFRIFKYFDANDDFFQEFGIEFKNTTILDSLLNKKIYNTLYIEFLDLQANSKILKKITLKYFVEIPKDIIFEPYNIISNCTQFINDKTTIRIGNTYNFGSLQTLDSIKIIDKISGLKFEPLINNYKFEFQNLPKTFEKNKPIELLIKNSNYNEFKNLEITYYFTNPQNKIYKSKIFNFSVINEEFSFLNLNNYQSSQSVQITGNNSSDLKYMLNYKNNEILKLDSVVFPSNILENVEIKLKDNTFPIILNNNCKDDEIYFSLKSNRYGNYEGITRLYFTKNEEVIYREMYISVRVSPSTDIEKFDIANLQIFPNPSSDKISLDLGGVAVAGLVVYDILGNEILSIPNYTSKVEIDISTLSIGTYTIQIQTNTGSLSQRFVKY